MLTRSEDRWRSVSPTVRLSVANLTRTMGLGSGTHQQLSEDSHFPLEVHGGRLKSQRQRAWCAIRRFTVSAHGHGRRSMAC